MQPHFSLHMLFGSVILPLFHQKLEPHSSLKSGQAYDFAEQNSYAEISTVWLHRLSFVWIIKDNAPPSCSLEYSSSGNKSDDPKVAVW